MSDNKLKIRINLQQSQSSEFSDQHEHGALNMQANPEYWNVLEKPPFDWRKITLASIVFIVFSAIVGYVILNIPETKTRIDTGDMHLETASLENYAARFNTFDDEPPVISPENLQSIIPPETAAPEQSESKQTEPKQIESTASITSKKQNNLADTPNIPLPPSKPVSANKTAVQLAPIPVNKPTVLPASEQTKTLRVEEVKNASNNRNSAIADAAISAADHPGVIRAQLTQQILKREPVDEIVNITLEGNNPKAIYFFAELHDFENKTVTVDWYFGDRLITQTKLHINHKHWRTHAKKLLRKQDAGHWQVKLHDQAGNVLAERFFIVEK